MPNMSHCRFTNTLADLQDCYDNMDDDLSPDEAKAQNKLLLLCARIASDYASEIETERERKLKLLRRTPPKTKTLVTGQTVRA
jgi:hypothetical protein